MHAKGLMLCDGVVRNIPPKMIIPETPEDFKAAKEYYGEREQSDFLCKKYKRCK